MIRFSTYILLIALTLQSFYRSIMTVDYQIHLSDYIAKCINQDKPQLHCDGQCVLMQKIAKKEREETKKNLVNYEYSSYYINKEKTDFVVYPVLEVSESESVSPYLIDYSFDYNTAVFRPPIA